VAVILKDEDVNLLEVDVAHMEADRVPLRKDLGNVGTVDAVITSLRSAGRHCGRSNYISEKCWEKFGRPEWVQLSESDSSAPRSTSQDYSSTFSTLP